MNEEDKELYKNALNIFGVVQQMVVTMEEMSELTKELSKFIRNKGDVTHICEEIADVEVMLEQMKLLFDIEDFVESFKRCKKERLKALISGEKEQGEK